MKFLKYCLWAILLPVFNNIVQGQAKQNTRLGKVIAMDSREGLAGATLMLVGSKRNFTTDDKGIFTVPILGKQDTLVVSYVGFVTQRITLYPGDQTNILITLVTESTAVGDVMVSTGYQTLPKERATGSFDVVDNKLFNRMVGTNVLDHIENVVPGILFNHGDAGSTDPILIRGRSSIFSSVSPLIVVDNFPYDGDITSINPNDIGSVTLLKDAAAASIWGARAGNGVIVVTTKKGKTGKPQVQLNTSTTIIQKPDLYSMRTLGSADYIGLEQYLYGQGYYAGALTDPSNPPVTPVVELLNAAANGTIPPAEANSRIDAFKNYDVRRDLSRYFYKPGTNQQSAVNVSGATPALNYFMSAGWDHDLNIGNLAGTQYDRVTLKTQNSFRVSDRLQADAGVSFVQSNNQSGNNPGYAITGLYPYARLADANGIGLDLDNTYRKIFTDTAGGGTLPNWKYNPLDDIGYTKNATKIRDYLINAAIRYKLAGYLSVELKYQYENSLTSYSTLYTDSSFYARNLINSFYQPATGAFPVPIGGIEDVQTTEIISHQGRAQVNYTQNFHQKHHVTALAGYEIKDLVTTGSKYRLYGYQGDRSIVNSQVDFVDYFQQFNNPNNSSQVPNPQFISQTTDRFLSWFGNASYNYDNRYTISTSARSDAANLFGVSTNQKGVPLWSAGAAWQLNNEKFYHLKILPYLKLRATYGYNGNFSRLASALTTVNFNPSYTTGATAATIQNPPNADLRWEQVRMLNLGVDFESKNKILSGSLEFYTKDARDLIAPVSLDPTLGFSGDVYQNTASMKGHGFDVQLNSRNIDGRFKWYSAFLFSYASTAVSKYLVPVSSNGSGYLNNEVINPVVGKPLYTVYSYRWGGLDPATGNPVGYTGKTPSTDYSSITSTTGLDSLVYNGPVQPVYFGAFRNTFTWKNFSLSFNISYKLGYYFRKQSVNYSNLYSGWYWDGNGDYAKRWQNPGDEKHTTVPSAVYPANGLRDDFYAYSGVLVENAGNIRLEDIRLDYVFDKAAYRRLPFRQITLYMYASNLGVLWTANKDHIDPYYNSSPAAGRNVAVGLNISF